MRTEPRHTPVWAMGGARAPTLPARLPIYAVLDRGRTVADLALLYASSGNRRRRGAEERGHM
jgi:hypothetical protein